MRFKNFKKKITGLALAMALVSGFAPCPGKVTYAASSIDLNFTDSTSNEGGEALGYKWDNDSKILTFYQDFNSLNQEVTLSDVKLPSGSMLVLSDSQTSVDLPAVYTNGNVTIDLNGGRLNANTFHLKNTLTVTDGGTLTVANGIQDDNYNYGLTIENATLICGEINNSMNAETLKLSNAEAKVTDCISWCEYGGTVSLEKKSTLTVGTYIINKGYFTIDNSSSIVVSKGGYVEPGSDSADLDKYLPYGYTIGYPYSGAADQYILNEKGEYQCGITMRNYTHAISATAGDGGSITPGGSDTIKEGETKTYIITPEDGYEIYKVTVNGENYTVTKNSNGSATLTLTPDADTAEVDAI